MAKQKQGAFMLVLANDINFIAREMRKGGFEDVGSWMKAVIREREEAEGLLETQKEKYLDIRQRYDELTREQHICGLLRLAESLKENFDELEKKIPGHNFGMCGNLVQFVMNHAKLHYELLINNQS